MTSPLPPDTTARLTALTEQAVGHAAVSAHRAQVAEDLGDTLRHTGLTGREQVRRAAVRAVAAARRDASRADHLAGRAAAGLARVRAGEATPAEVGAEVAECTRLAGLAARAATGALGRAARLVAGLGACAGPHPAGPVLWAAGWDALCAVPLAEVPGGRVRTPRTPADAEAELAGVVAHLQAQAPAFVSLEVAGTVNRYVQAYADDGGLRVESVSNRYLGRPERLTRAETTALTAAGLHAPTQDAPNWYLDLPAVPANLAGSLLVRLLEIHDPGLRRGFRVRTVADHHREDQPETEPESGGVPGEQPEPGTVVEGVAGPMLVVAAEEPEVEAHALALAQVLDPWVRTVGWDGVVVVVDQAGCPFAAEVAPTAGVPTARLLPYVEAPAPIEATLRELGWHVADEAGHTWWRRRFAPTADAMEVLDALVETLHAVCGFRLESHSLVQVAPA